MLGSNLITLARNNTVNNSLVGTCMTLVDVKRFQKVTPDVIMTKEQF